MSTFPHLRMFKETANATSNDLPWELDLITLVVGIASFLTFYSNLHFVNDQTLFQKLNRNDIYYRNQLTF